MSATSTTSTAATSSALAPSTATGVMSTATAIDLAKSVGDMTGMTGARKAAILILKLGIDRAGPLLRQLERHELAMVTRELASLGSVDLAVANKILSDFTKLASGEKPLPIADVALAKEYLVANLGKRRAREILSALDETAPSVPFQFLDALPPDVIAAHLALEHPQTIALVISHLSPDFASLILESIDETLVADIGVRLAMLDQVASTSLARVEAGVRERLAPVLENRFLELTGGTDTLVELLTRLDKSLQEQVIEGLNAVDPELGQEVKNKLFVFDDMRILDDRQIQMVLRSVDANRLPLALKGVDPVVRDLFLNNLSSRARENLVDEMGLMGSVRIAEVEDAQAEILATVASLEESGELVINRGGADFVS